MVQKVFFNALEKPENREMKDLTGREITILAPLCALMIVIGWNPTPILSRMEASVQVVLDRVEAAAPAGTVSASVELAPGPILTTEPNDDADDENVIADDE